MVIGIFVEMVSEVHMVMGVSYVVVIRFSKLEVNVNQNGKAFLRVEIIPS